jgi:hypothetical protein
LKRKLIDSDFTTPKQGRLCKKWRAACCLLTGLALLLGCQDEHTLSSYGALTTDTEHGVSDKASDSDSIGQAMDEQGAGDSAANDFDTGFFDDRPPLAGGLGIVRIQLFQSVGITLMEYGQVALFRNAPVVRGKDALIRIHVQRDPDWVDRQVEARVELFSDNGPLASLSDYKTIFFDSRVDSLDSTFNIEIPGEHMTENLTYRVSLFDKTPDASGPSQPLASWPEVGMAPLGVEAGHGKIKLVIVPVAYQADGSGRLPETDSRQIDQFAEYFYRFYPVTWDGVEIRVDDPISWQQEVSANGDGWDDLLAAIDDLRDERKASRDEYYYGLVSPGESLWSFCHYGCVTGLAYVVEETGGNQWGGLSAVGVGFEGETAAEVMIHEVGHNHGLKHAPCRADDYDWNYPYYGGTIGVWGYDLVEEELKDPMIYTDFMGNCENKWVSDYTYTRIFNRIQEVCSQPAYFGIKSRWRSFRVRSNGEVVPGRRYELSAAPKGALREVLLLDADLDRVDVVNGFFTGYDNLPGGIILFRDPGTEVKYAQLEGAPPVECCE